MHFKIFWLQKGKGNSHEVVQVETDESRTAESFCNRLGKKEQVFEGKQNSDSKGGKT